MIHKFYLISLFSGIVNLLLAAFVLSINPTRRLNRMFFVMGFGLAWWNFGSYAQAGSQNPIQTLFIVRLMLLGIIFLPAVFYHFSVETTGQKNRKVSIALAYVVSVVFAALSFNPYFIEGVREHSAFFRPKAGPAFWIFCTVYYPITTIGTLSTLIRFIRTTQPSLARPAKALLTALSLLYIGGVHDMLLAFGLDMYPGTQVRIRTWGTLSATLYVLLVGYSIFSDQMLDVRVSISRHAATILRLFFLGAIAYILMLGVGAVFPTAFTMHGLVALLVVLLISAAITGRCFPKLFGGLSGRLEHGVLGDRFEYQDKVGAFIDAAPEVDNFQKLLDQAADVVFGQLSLSSVGIAILKGDSQTQGHSLRETFPKGLLPGLLTGSSPLMQVFRNTGVDRIDTKNEFNLSAEDRPLRALLTSAFIEIVLPIGERWKDPMGVLVVGSRRDGRALTKLDVELLQRLCRNLVVRVERIASFYNDELRESNGAKDRFLSSINHEIRNPLNGITGIVQMLEEANLDPRSTFLLSTLRACSDQLRSSMDDVLDFTCIESEQITLTLSAVNLVALVRSTCATQDTTGSMLILREPSSSGVIVHCDEGKIRQILSNYLANALKYGTPAGAFIELFTNPTSQGMACIRIEVTSTGPTLTREEVSGLFTALTRGRRARETNAHGTGLGLALSKKLAEAMGGSVGVTSLNNRTTFWFTANFQTSETPISPVRSPKLYSGRHVLAIEDEPYNRLVLEHHLKRFGMTVSWATDGKSALESASQGKFDLIVMDWLLPDMDGSELLRKIRETIRIPLPPVIVLTAYSTTGKKAECLAAGAVSFISKPLDVAKLSAAFDLCSFR